MGGTCANARASLYFSYKFIHTASELSQKMANSLGASNNDNYKAARFLGNRLELPTIVRIGVSLLNTPQAADCSKD